MHRSRETPSSLARSRTRAAWPSLGPPLVFAATLISALAAPATEARAQVYPRLGLYGVIDGDGYPFWDANGVLQDTTLDAVARYHEVILDASPITPYRPDVLAALRARHPGIKLYAFVTGNQIWDASEPDSFVHYPTRYKRLVRDLGGWLYNTSGGTFTNARVNIAKRDECGRLYVAEAVADLFQDVIASAGVWDGVFIDICCKSILWMETPTEHIDYVRAGYPTLSAFDAAWGMAIDTLGNRLRRIAGPTFEMIGNCAPSPNYASFNGWMGRENFPFQNGDWYQNMFRDVGGYFTDEERYRTPRSNYLFSAMVGVDPYSSANTRKVRFGLGSAALGSGYAVFGPSDKSARPYPYWMWWYDEYAVDLTTGRSSAGLQNAGWLGQALAPYTQMIWIGPAPDAVTNSNFETDVTSGWTFAHAVPATVTRDASTAAVGSASAHVTVSALGGVSWDVAYQTLNTMALTAWQPYSATFWAKASPPRTLTIAAGPNASARVEITASWRRYQATMFPHASGTAGLQIFFADALGDVWLDDVHFQAGVTSLYRRDFQNGIVLVNPAAQAMTTTLERSYRKILGTRDPAVNNGSTVTQVTVNANDALFLILSP
ncbi:MAG TPA: carbohydrate binding domain-containing protein [Candidatus Eisenbacteria bacterium]